jgi:uncharacterized protein
MARPLPTPDPCTSPYWAAVSEKHLRLPRCTACQRFHFYPRPLCPYCHSASHEWVDGSGKGEVYSFTVVHRAPSPAFSDAAPYVVANIRLEEGVHLMSTVVGCPPSEVRIGMPVRLIFTAVEESYLPAFEPIP